MCRAYAQSCSIKAYSLHFNTDVVSSFAILRMYWLMLIANVLAVIMAQIIKKYH
jgi:hypothetical protein